MVIYTKPAELVACSSLEECKAEVILVPVYQKDEKPLLEGLAAKIDEQSGGLVSRAGEKGIFRAGRGETFTLPLEDSVYVLVGLGKKEGDLKDNARRAFGKAAKSLVDKYKTVLINLDGLDSGVAREALIGFLLGAYKLEAFKSEKKSKLSKVYYTGVDVDSREIQAIVEGVYLARDVANAPPNDLYPEKLAAKVVELFSGFENVEVEVFDYDRLVREGFGGIVNVGKGSVHKPRLIIIHVKGEGKKLALVGKTLVFDAGGMQIKPGYSMMTMYADKAGGAAVLGVAWVLAKLGTPFDFYALLGAAINVPSGESYLPSDVITMWDGTKVDIGHTDAEGRLVIADAIAYAAKKIEAETIIDLATLTGAAVVALGPLIAALFTRDDKLASIIEEAAKETGDLVWRMPMADVYRPLLTKGVRLGDVNNVSGRWAGAIYGALFLERFSHGKKFVHLDIAGPGIGGSDVVMIAPEYWPGKHAPGYGVRLIVETIKKLSEEQ